MGGFLEWLVPEVPQKPATPKIGLSALPLSLHSATRASSCRRTPPAVLPSLPQAGRARPRAHYNKRVLCAARNSQGLGLPNPRIPAAGRTGASSRPPTDFSKIP